MVCLCFVCTFLFLIFLYFCVSFLFLWRKSLEGVRCLKAENIKKKFKSYSRVQRFKSLVIFCNNMVSLYIYIWVSWVYRYSVTTV